MELSKILDLGFLIRWYYAVKFSKRSVYMSMHKSQKRSARNTCSYISVGAQIMLKIGMTSTTNIRNQSFKFEKDPLSSSREIVFLLHGFMSTISEASMQYSSGARQAEWATHCIQIPYYVWSTPDDN